MLNTKKRMANKTVIGIDPGVQTGIAVKVNGHITWIGSSKLWNLFEYLSTYSTGDYIYVIEDARKRSGGFASAQGAGWVKTLCGQIEAYMIAKGKNYKMIAPIRNGTKLSRAQIKKITGFDEVTNEHERDAIMIAWTN